MIITKIAMTILGNIMKIESTMSHEAIQCPEDKGSSREHNENAHIYKSPIIGSDPNVFSLIHRPLSVVKVAVPVCG